MTQARLQSDKPIDDELPFDDGVPGDRVEAPQEIDAHVTPAAAERQRVMPDPDVEPSEPPGDATDLTGEDGRAP
jgi:hypothetical protein